MFYTIIIIIFGIYLGQEYTLPSIKLLSINCFSYLQNIAEKQEEQVPKIIISESWFTNLFSKK